MALDHLIVFSVPGLRVRDVGPHTTPTLYAWANRGAIMELTPTFPGVTSCVQASMLTGLPPGEHAVIANGFYHRDRREVEFWVGRNNVVQGESVWEALKKRRPSTTSAVWYAQNIKDAAADFIVTPAPIHEPGGTTKLWCYSKPEGLYQELLAPLGHFPLQHYWGPLSNIESTRWILRGALWLIERHRPNLHWIYLPHLDYAGQKFGPNSPQAMSALAELDRELAAFAERLARLDAGSQPAILVVGEYAITEVTGVVYPNRILREAGCLVFRREESAEYLNLGASRAFAMVDHQFTHIYVNSDTSRERKGAVKSVADLFAHRPGLAGVYMGEQRRQIGLDHPRSGDVILVAEDSHWFAYYWWMDDAAAPPFARTVDIHRKPGYDPVELFFDPATRGIPLDTALVKGSHGVPATEARHRPALMCSSPLGDFHRAAMPRDVDVKALCLRLLAPAP